MAFRTFLVPEVMPDAAAARRAVRRALFWIRRDAGFVSLGSASGLAALRRFRRTPPLEPGGAELVRHRLEFAEFPSGSRRRE